MGLSSSQANQVFAMISKGDQLEYDYLGSDKSGKVEGFTLGGQPRVQNSFGGTHIISEMSLTSSNYTSYLKINGRSVINNGKLC
tara:strand:+ start:1285 stop:1536 length:252 start_codon:yes stop_codon:yes gene_type:complete